MFVSFVMDRHIVPPVDCVNQANIFIIRPKNQVRQFAEPCDAWKGWLYTQNTTLQTLCMSLVQDKTSAISCTALEANTSTVLNM